ncbi:Hypoxic response protein 1 [Hartmannibacter diazotrophicus]|uniref:Hypoxic response protein 1 n=1 Tax=Hartmannibacter diazotrophicus TaxID=1482074 RepID=A0A2C9D5D1_9HYPH|nr:CBS domain-containing protein [Hartmannibacter diazotrophicus]SON55433.1 Hypoxic response protein 1 [Hartmannibacter diazotrophicus]
MTVQMIISQKGGDVTTGTVDMTIAQVAEVLSSRKIGAMVIVDIAERVIGILSERDIVRVIAQRGASVLSAPASEVMTRNVITCAPRDTIEDVMLKMTNGRFRHVPVIDNNHLAGIISIGDVVKHRMAEIEREAEQMRSYIATA